MSMLARVLVLSLGLTCGMASGLVGLKWFIGGNTQSSEVEPKRADTDEKVQRLVSRYDWLWYASIPMVLWTAPLGMAGGVLGGMGRGKIAAIPLFLAVLVPACISGWTLLVTFGLFFAGCLGFLIRKPENPSQAGLKGCFNAVKGWFNIGGVKVKFGQPDINIPKAGNSLNVSVELTAKSDRHINAVFVKLIKEQTKKKEDRKESKENVLGETSQAVALDLKAGETRVLNFRLPYAYKQSLKESAVGLAGGGLMGSMASMAADMATGSKEQYLLVAQADVDGALFEPSDRKKVTLV
jgi:hypothetical protein